MMESFATPYPVVFHDGDHEHDKGQIGVHSTLNFKRFQALLSQKTGIPANQMTVVLVCKKSSKYQRLPIHDHTNFNSILNQHNPMWEKDCYFSVSLKKPKRERRGGNRRRNVDSENGDTGHILSPERSWSSSAEWQGPQDHQGRVKDFNSKVSRLDNALKQPVNSGVQRPKNSISPDKILLRRDQKPSDGLTFNQQNINNLVGLKATSSYPSNTTPMQVDMQRMDRLWAQSQTMDGMLANRSDLNIAMSQLAQFQGVVSQQIPQEFQERYNEVVSSQPALLYNSSIPTISPGLLQRNGFVNLPTSAGLPSISGGYPTSPSMLIPSMASNGLASANVAALKLQQAQAQYLNFQTQDLDQLQFTQQALSQMRGVVQQGLAAFESENHMFTGVCRHCCSSRENNINPTPFHLCVHDRVTTGFRGPSPAGPIERPVKRVEAAA